MKDYLAQAEKLRKEAAECALIRDLATDRKKRGFWPACQPPHRAGGSGREGHPRTEVRNGKVRPPGQSTRHCYANRSTPSALSSPRQFAWSRAVAIVAPRRPWLERAQSQPTKFRAKSRSGRWWRTHRPHRFPIRGQACWSPIVTPTKPPTAAKKIIAMMYPMADTRPFGAARSRCRKKKMKAAMIARRGETSPSAMSGRKSLSMTFP